MRIFPKNRKFFVCLSSLLFVFLVTALTSCNDKYTYTRPVINEKDQFTQLPEKLFDFLENAEKFELITLNPKVIRDRTVKTYHGYRVLGRKIITNKKDRFQLVENLYTAINSRSYPMPTCFLPRHALSLYNEKDKLDILICFECSYARVYSEKEERYNFLLKGEPKLFNLIAKKYNLTCDKSSTGSTPSNPNK